MEYRLVEKYDPPRKMRTKAGVVALDGSVRLAAGARVYLMAMTAIPGTWENGLLIRDEKGTEYHVMTGSLKAGW